MSVNSKAALQPTWSITTEDERVSGVHSVVELSPEELEDVDGDWELLLSAEPCARPSTPALNAVAPTRRIDRAVYHEASLEAALHGRDSDDDS